MANTAKETKVKKTVKAEVKNTTTMNKKPEIKIKGQTMSGIVVSAKMQNTVVVAIERKVAHKLYGKLIRVTKKIKADTNGMEVNEGDVITIMQTKPISRDKNFKVVRKESSK
jgi:small subunit ribosomal protein S17